MSQFAKKVLHSVIDLFVSFFGGIIIAILVMATLIKVNSLKANSYGVTSKEPNLHRRTAIMATVAMCANFFVSLLSYHYFLMGKGGPSLISFVCVVINLVVTILMAVLASSEIRKAKVIN
jgi:hypothetical protein